jgi:hypothetical protein
MQTTPTMSPQVQTPAGPAADGQLRQRAIARIRMQNFFKLALVVNLLFDALFVVIWATTGAGYFWPMWPILGLAPVTAIIGYLAYGGNTITEDQINREMKRLS